MSEKDKKKVILKTGEDSAKAEESASGDFKINSISSAETIKKDKKEDVSLVGALGKDELSAEKDSRKTSTGETLNVEKNVEKDDAAKIENLIFKELAEPKLPELREENRARLQMQSPTRLNFYWSVKTNPFETLRSVFGSQSQSYALVVKLLNQTNNRQEIFPIEARGYVWFDVDADAEYQAEIGFYAANRPFVRIMFSNTIETPRNNPSPHPASADGWSISAENFARVLDNSGFAQDAFEAALAGDDFELAEAATKGAFAHFFGETGNDFAADDSSEMRLALLALASGFDLENLRGQISTSLFAKLQATAENLSAEKALVALRENFGVFAAGDTENTFFSPTVFGASLINFPRASKRKFLPKFAPVSSFRAVK